MKKRILAALVAVTMAVSVFAGLTASADESSLSIKEWWGGAGATNEIKVVEVEGHDGQQTNVLSIQNDSYATGSFGTICSGLDAGKTYKFFARIRYDFSSMNLHNPNSANEQIARVDGLLGTEWKTVEMEFTGVTDVLLSVQTQATFYYNNATGYLDDVTITDPDGTVVFLEDFEPEATPVVPSASATATAEVDNTGAILFEEDFEDGETIITVGNGSTDFNEDTTGEGDDKVPDTRTSYSIIKNPVDPSDSVFNIHDATWGQFSTNTFVEGLDSKKEYTMKLRIMGDTAWFSMANQAMAIVGCNTGKQYLFPGDGLLQEWKTYVFKFTGVKGVAFCGQVQASDGWKNANIYLDDIIVYEGDMVEQLLATPTPAPATPTPTVTPSTTPTATATVTPVPESPSPVVKVKFKKSKVTVKKGKKKVLKVTLKNAKKAKFSVNKKGKKIVKLSKKKAKSVTVTGKKKGKATVTAKAAGKKAKCKVTVKK